MVCMIIHDVNQKSMVALSIYNVVVVVAAVVVVVEFVDTHAVVANRSSKCYGGS
jgi:hypothetical protein